MRGARKYSRRGMSVIVSTLLLVVATGVIGSALAAWSNSSFAIQSSQISNQTASRINLVKESFVLEDVWFYTKQPGSVHSANVTIRNTGDLAITVSKIYVNNTQVWSGSQTIAIDSVATIKDVPVSWHSNDMQSVWIHTARGTDVKQAWKS
jgi:hypothetical protein